MKKWFSLAVSISLMAVIFVFSCQDGARSSVVSNQATLHAQQNPLASALTPGWFSAANSNANLRKWAHLYIYFALGFSAACTVSAFGCKKWRAIVCWPVLWCALYAATDEIHQWFVPGRAAMWQDVLLDTAGALLGVLLFCASAFIWRHIQAWKR